MTTVGHGKHPWWKVLIFGWLEWWTVHRLSKRRARLLTDAFDLLDMKETIDSIRNSMTEKENREWDGKISEYVCALTDEGIELGIVMVVLFILGHGKIEVAVADGLSARGRP
jgi:hypothetical protein